MNLKFETVSSYYKESIPYLEKLRLIFNEMDSAYASIADQYGFRCNGCADNCCETKFYHHTLLEYFYIYNGFITLDLPSQKQIREQAFEVCEEHSIAEAANKKIRVMCPVNFDGLCILYKYRPMICRLHGIPHELTAPGKESKPHPGCGAFSLECRDIEYIKFDRTPFYFRLAGLEKELREKINMPYKLKMTVARMLREITR